MAHGDDELHVNKNEGFLDEGIKGFFEKRLVPLALLVSFTRFTAYLIISQMNSAKSSQLGNYMHGHPHHWPPQMWPICLAVHTLCHIQCGKLPAPIIRNKYICHELYTCTGTQGWGLGLCSGNGVRCFTIPLCFPRFPSTRRTNSRSRGIIGKPGRYYHIECS